MQLIRSAQPIMDAFKVASSRGVLPTELGSGGLAKLGKGLWQQSFFSARTNNAQYLSHLKGLVDRYIKGGYNNDLGQLRVEARAMLKQLGYNPTTGFPEDFGRIPEAEEGSLQDLGSEKRLNLIFQTQADLARGLTQQAMGVSRMSSYPAWELGRVAARKQPRGSEGSHSVGWQRRWVQCGGKLVDGGRMIALKDDPIWAKLGSREMFPDTLDVDHPPFAFNSGMGWSKELSCGDCVKLGIISEAWSPPASPDEVIADEPKMPTPPKSIDKATMIALLKSLSAGGKKFSEAGLREAIQSQLAKHQASNDARHLQAAFLGGLMLQQHLQRRAA